MRRKVGVFLDMVPHGGGAYQYDLSILDAVAHLPPDQYDVTVVYTNEHWRLDIKNYSNVAALYAYPSLLDRIMVKCLKFGLFPARLWKLINTRLSSLAKQVAARDCHVWIFPSQDEWAYFFSVPALCSIHDLMHRYEPEFPEVSAFNKYLRREMHYKKLCKWCDGLLVDSQTGKRQVTDSYTVRPDKIFVLPFVAAKYIYADTMTERIDIDYSLPEKFIFYPAQFWKHKNHERLIHAIVALRHEHPDLHMVFIGSKKNNYQAIRDLVTSHGLDNQIHFLSYIPNEQVPQLYRRARAMIMPTFFGPTNIPPLEAFACGCPIAVSDIYAMPEQVGDAALLFDPRSVEQIAACIKRLWLDDSLCEDLSKKGLERDQQWNQAHFNKQLSSIIDNISAKRIYQ